jgi:hypothetical protein
MLVITHPYYIAFARHAPKPGPFINCPRSCVCIQHQVRKDVGTQQKPSQRLLLRLLRRRIVFGISLALLSNPAALARALSALLSFALKCTILLSSTALRGTFGRSFLRLSHLVLLLAAVGFGLLLFFFLFLRLFLGGLFFRLLLGGRLRLWGAFLGLVLASGFVLVGSALLLVLLGKFGSLYGKSATR